MSAIIYYKWVIQLAKAQDHDKLEEDLAADIEKANGKNPSPNDVEAYAMSHILFCLTRNYDAAGMGMNWAKDTLLRDLISKAKDYLNKIPICNEHINKMNLLITSKRKYHTRKK